MVPRTLRADSAIWKFQEAHTKKKKKKKKKKNKRRVRTAVSNHEKL